MSRRASSESTSSGIEEFDRITCEDGEFRCREIVASPFHASDPLLAAAQLALTQSGDDVGLSDEEVVPYINALRIVHGDDHSAVAAYDRARLTDSGALRSAKARLRAEVGAVAKLPLPSRIQLHGRLVDAPIGSKRAQVGLCLDHGHSTRSARARMAPVPFHEYVDRARHHSRGERNSGGPVDSG